MLCPVIPKSETVKTIKKIHIKKARESELIAHPADRLSHCLCPRISNAEAHAVCISKRKSGIIRYVWTQNTMSIHGIYKTMGIGHCLTLRKIWIYQIRSAADKTLTQRLLYVLPPAFRPSGASVRTTVQKYEFLELQGDVFFFFQDTFAPKKCTESIG